MIVWRVCVPERFRNDACLARERYALFAQQFFDQWIVSDEKRISVKLRGEVPVAECVADRKCLTNVARPNDEEIVRFDSYDND